jgi:hypothetical protein
MYFFIYIRILVKFVPVNKKNDTFWLYYTENRQGQIKKFLSCSVL